MEGRLPKPGDNRAELSTYRCMDCKRRATEELQWQENLGGFHGSMYVLLD